MRFVPLLTAALLTVLVTNAAAATAPGPTGLHGFLLQADEPLQTSFHRTPSFAWKPVAGASRYEFQLSTSSTFRDNGVLYDNAKLLTPVASPPLTLPWITGSPHALWARVRALTATGATSWGRPFGFDVVPPAPPTPLASAPGLLRWTPIDGADAYEVWLLDAGKLETVHTNVLDEREFYAFHTSAAWIGTVHWRVRALRDDVASARINGIPAAQPGAWSPIYTSTNPAVADGPLKLDDTLSDVSSDGSASSAAHALTPAFTWTGDRSLTGLTASLFRVYVFTDAQCLNPVYTSPVVGSPAYAPRLGGPLAMPTTTLDAQAAATTFLGDGSETGDVAYDGTQLTPNEELPAAQPTVTVPGDVSAAAGAATGSSSASGGASASSSATSVGPPVDLWDTAWPSSGYYWTVIPVLAAGAANTTVANPGAAAGSTVLPVSSTLGFATGDTITIGVAPTVESATVTGVGATSVTLKAPLKNDHLVDEQILRHIRYVDLELPQDACAAGRVQRFGIESEPTVTTAQAPFATGLSSAGRLVSAVKTGAFYGQPLVAWTPAMAASVYEVQWSPKRYPFTAQPDPSTGLNGVLTHSTSAVLPLAPGTWWYRVRGFDYNLPTGVQQMSWSEPQKLVVAAPKFKVSVVKTKTKFKVVGKGK